jgi:hypothetical protein
MSTIHPGVTGRTVEPLLVSPCDAWRILGCGNTHGYELLKACELESFLDGRSRKITVESIRQYIARKLAAAGAIGTEDSAQRRRRGRRRKYQGHETPT